MARIAIEARESGTTTGRYVDKLVEYLAALNSEHQFIVLTKPHRAEFMRKLAPKFEVVSSDIKEFSFAEQLGLMTQIKKLKPDLVHFTMTQQPVLYQGKVVTTIHDLTTARFINPTKNPLVFRTKRYIYTKVIKKVAAKSERIITPSNYVKEDLVQFTQISPKKVNVIYEAADRIQDKSQPIERLVDKKFITYVGRPQLHKNLRRLIDAFVIIQKSRPDLRLVLAGKSDELYDQHKDYIRKLSIRNVLLTGFVGEGQLRWLYENTAAYIFPSLSEGFGLPGLEAMAHGAPVVSSNATCLPEVYGNGALYFNPEDTSDIAEKITSVLENSTLRDKLIKNGQKQSAKYSWGKMAAQTLEIYESALR